MRRASFWSNSLVLGTFNNANIVQIPAKPAFKDLKLTLGSTVAVSTNLWTKQQQVYDWMAGWWEAQITIPPMKLAQARQWFAFLAELRGQTNVFWCSDPLCIHPSGSPQGNPVVNGTTASGYSIATTGWANSANNLLLPGDYIQIGHRLYLVTETVNSNSTGNASITIQPQFRSNDPDVSTSMPIITTNAKGLFRLKSSPVSWSTAENKLYGIQLEVSEAL